jgi:hypothetical protein
MSCLLNQNKAEVVIAKTELLILPKPDTLESTDNVAVALSCQANYDEAEGMHRRAPEVREKSLGKEHLDTLSSMNNMRWCYVNYDKAERMHCQVFDIRQKVLDPEHPDTLMSMSNLASGLLNYRGKYDEAMGIRRRVRPSYHYNVRGTTRQCLRIYNNSSQI